MIDYLTDPTHGVVEFTVDGPITKQDYDRIVAEIDGAIDRFGKLRLIEVIKDVGAIDSAVWWADIKWAATHLKHVARCAVVTDKGWIGAITRAVGAVLPAEIRVFHLAEIDEARAWVRES
ncbi:MAG TPA: STAS/SEC14 domain-containing protein [Sphingomonas sp.]|nr:STAS/SEC14 domain-containing protein [Sphingomonas sp.]